MDTSFFPLQTTQAYATFANRGELMRPYLVKEITKWTNR